MLRNIVGVAIVVLACAASALPAELYVTTTTGRFGRLDPQTGTYTQIGNTNPVLVGLGYGPDGSLYGFEDGALNARLFRVNPANAALTFVGNTGIPSTYVDPNAGGGWAMGGTSDGHLYAFSWQPPTLGPNAYLYSIDPATAQSTQIGNMGFPTYGTINGDGSGGLYATTGGTNEFFQLNRTTGAGTLLGSGSFGTVFAMGFTGGTMYAMNINGQIYSVNLNNGASTLVSTYNVSALGQMYAAAPVPEPAALLLVVLGAAAIVRRR